MLFLFCQQLQVESKTWRVWLSSGHAKAALMFAVGAWSLLPCRETESLPPVGFQEAAEYFAGIKFHCCRKCTQLCSPAPCIRGIKCVFVCGGIHAVPQKREAILENKATTPLPGVFPSKHRGAGQCSLCGFRLTPREDCWAPCCV